jgi:hypothetical protein
MESITLNGKEYLLKDDVDKFYSDTGNSDIMDCANVGMLIRIPDDTNDIIEVKKPNLCFKRICEFDDDEKVLVFDKSKGGIDWKGRYRFDYERIVEYFKIPELHSDIKKEFEDDNINITNYDYFLAQVDMALEILTIKDLFSDDISKKFKQ